MNFSIHGVKIVRLDAVGYVIKRIGTSYFFVEPEIYEFILPYTILDALTNKSSEKLCKYLKVRPSKQFTMLDCHDGIPVKPDMDDLIDTNEARKLIDICLDRGSNLSLIQSEGHKAEDGFDVHQIRCSYYSVL